MRGTSCARILTPMTDANQAARKALHWADSWADAIIRERGDLDAYTYSAGITPSGTVHIGNFREIISVDLVVRALRDRGKKTHCPPLCLRRASVRRSLRKRDSAGKPQVFCEKCRYP